MSRFTPTRRNRIVAWTGAALAWGTAVTVAKLEPARAEPEPPGPEPAFSSSTTTVAPVPEMPSEGLVVLRYRPSEEAQPEVTTVYVRRTVSPAQAPAAPSTPAPSPPSPKSSGS